MNSEPTLVYLSVNSRGLSIKIFVVLISLIYTGAKIVTQQSNIALVAALLLTIQFSFAYAIPSMWGPMVSPDDMSYSYLASVMTPDQLDIVHEVVLRPQIFCSKQRAHF